MQRQLLKKTDVLCRVVSDWGHDTDRFIPWPNKVQNHWNPPGRTYLFLFFAEKKLGRTLWKSQKGFLLWIKKTRNFMRTLIANMLKQQ